MLNIRQVKHLARFLEFPPDQIAKTLENVDEHYETLRILDPAKPDKEREVVNVTGAIRQLQNNLYSRVLLRKLTPSAFTHGGIRGRSIKTNAEAHRQSRFVFKTDIFNFYPSIHHSRVYRIFSHDLGCSPDVAHLCTKICTYKHHLALGLITSPILADFVVSNRIDHRIGIACQKSGLVYTRFVDDITISGPFDLQKSGFEKLVTGIVNNAGFHVNVAKNEFKQLGKDTAITGIRILKGNKLDVKKEYAIELNRQLEDLKNLAQDQNFEGPYFTEAQIRGRIQFVLWINPRRGSHLMKNFNSISWRRVESAARKQGLIASKKTLIKCNPASQFTTIQN